MDALTELTLLEAADGFVARHIGPSDAEIAAMLHEVGAATLDDLAAKTVPPTILSNRALDLPPPIDEAGVLAELRGLAADNVVKKSLIGMGYHGTHTPPVVQRNVLENPGWYTAYTPYQAEIAQGRLEALLNFQTLITDLTGMEIANASICIRRRARWWRREPSRSGSRWSMSHLVMSRRLRLRVHSRCCCNIPVPPGRSAT
jgi:glycine dehydrogenase